MQCIWEVGEEVLFLIFLTLDKSFAKHGTQFPVTGIPFLPGIRVRICIHYTGYSDVTEIPEVRSSQISLLKLISFWFFASADFEKVFQSIDGIVECTSYSIILGSESTREALACFSMRQVLV